MSENVFDKSVHNLEEIADITGGDGLVRKIIKDAVKHLPGRELEDYIVEKLIGYIPIPHNTQLPLQS